MAPLNMVPAVLVLQKLHLMNSLLGLILLYSALVTPFTVFLYYGFIGTVPREIDEAAIIDGCGPISLFVKVIFPLLKPVTVTVVILNFMNAWNDFITPFYVINESGKMPLTTMVYSFSDSSSEAGTWCVHHGNDSGTHHHCVCVWTEIYYSRYDCRSRERLTIRRREK